MSKLVVGARAHTIWAGPNQLSHDPIMREGGQGFRVQALKELQQCKFLGVAYVQKLVHALKYSLTYSLHFNVPKSFSPRHYPSDNFDTITNSKLWLAEHLVFTG